MPRLARTLQLLRGEPPAAVAAILAHALRRAEPSEHDGLCEAALSTGRPEGLAAVIERMHELGPSARRTIALAGPALAAALAVLRTRGGRRTLLNAAAAVRLGCLTAPDGPPSLAVLDDLEPMLLSDHQDVPRRAGQAVLAVIEAHAGADGVRLGRLTPSDRRRIDEALSRAASTYPRHRSREVLLAVALVAARPGPGLRRLLADPDDPALFALRGAAARVERASVRANMLRWMTIEPLGGQIARRLERISGPQAFADLLEAGHLLLAPARRRIMRRVDRPLRCLPDVSTAAALADDRQVGVVRLIRALPLPTAVRTERLADCIALTSPVARLHAVLELLGRESGGGAAALEPFCFDRDEPVSWLASRRVLDGSPPPGASCLGRLEHSPHEVVARRACRVAAGREIDAFFARWTRLDRNERIAIARRHLEASPGGLAAGLRRALHEGARPQQLDAIALARRLGLVGRLERELAALAASGDVRVASAAVSALGEGASAYRVEVIRESLEHPDTRVRANAVEAMRRADRFAVDHLDEPAASRDNRLRANAVLALLLARGGGGPAALLKRMLGDRDPRHRVSGVWVARRARARAALGDLTTMALRDRLPEVRSRAASAARLLERLGAT